VTPRIVFIILGATAATYLPRAIPFLLPFPARLPSGLARFLKVMPVAALGALIFPGVVLSFPELPLAGLAGVAAASAVSYWRGGMIFPVLASILASLGVLSLL